MSGGYLDPDTHEWKFGANRYRASLGGVEYFSTMEGKWVWTHPSQAIGAEFLRLVADNNALTMTLEESSEIHEETEVALKTALGVKRTPCHPPCGGHFYGGAQKLAEAHAARVKALEAWVARCDHAKGCAYGDSRWTREEWKAAVEAGTVPKCTCGLEELQRPVELLPEDADPSWKIFNPSWPSGDGPYLEQEEE